MFLVQQTVKQYYLRYMVSYTLGHYMSVQKIEKNLHILKPVQFMFIIIQNPWCLPSFVLPYTFDMVNARTLIKYKA
jgi:hypothetical protein